MSATPISANLKRCFCTKRCGGPDGPGVLKPASTYYRHTQAQSGAPGRGQRRRQAAITDMLISSPAPASSSAQLTGSSFVNGPAHSDDSGGFDKDDDRAGDLGIVYNNMDNSESDNLGQALAQDVSLLF